MIHEEAFEIFRNEMQRKKELLITEVLSTFWTKLDTDFLESSGIYKPLDTSPKSASIRFSQKYNLLKNTIFHYELNVNNTFLHFTDKVKAEKILQTKTFRMYDLNHMSDTLELEYTYDLLDSIPDGNKNIHSIKEELFCMSLSEPKNKENQYLWENYGDKKQGVCLVLTIEPPKDNYDWSSYYIGRVNYKNINELQVIEELKDKYIRFAKEKQFSINNFKILMSLIINFYKKSDPYENESEIRLIRYVEKKYWEKHNDKNIIYESNNKESVSFNEIHINQEQSGHPVIIIKNIIFGENFQIKDMESLKALIGEGLNIKL